MKQRMVVFSGFGGLWRKGRRSAGFRRRFQPKEAKIVAVSLGGLNIMGGLC